MALAAGRADASDGRPGDRAEREAEHGHARAARAAAQVRRGGHRHHHPPLADLALHGERRAALHGQAGPSVGHQGEGIGQIFQNQDFGDAGFVYQHLAFAHLALRGQCCTAVHGQAGPPVSHQAKGKKLTLK